MLQITLNLEKYCKKKLTKSYTYTYTILNTHYTGKKELG